MEQREEEEEEGWQPSYGSEGLLSGVCVCQFKQQWAKVITNNIHHKGAES
jgi:hypothetical protein